MGFSCCSHLQSARLPQQLSRLRVQLTRVTLLLVFSCRKCASPPPTQSSGYTLRRSIPLICEPRVLEHASQSQLSSQYLLLGSSTTFDHMIRLSKLGLIA